MYLSSILLLLMGLSGLYGTKKVQLRFAQKEQMSAWSVHYRNVCVRVGIRYRDVPVFPRA